MSSQEMAGPAVRPCVLIPTWPELVARWVAHQVWNGLVASGAGIAGISGHPHFSVRPAPTRRLRTTSAYARNGIDELASWLGSTH
jgi:hypothetical protein